MKEWFMQYDWRVVGLALFVVFMYFLNKFAVASTGKGIFKSIYESLKDLF